MVVRATGVAGSVIGTNDGLIGILLDTGEYVDVPEVGVKLLHRRRHAKVGRQSEPLIEGKPKLGASTG